MECSVCCEPFNEEGPHVPRNLDCGHTFCTACIERLETHAPLRQGPRCPDCRAVIRFNRRTARSLPKNFKLMELIREQRGTQKPQTNTTGNYNMRVPTTTALGMPAVPETRPSHGMMFMGNYLPPLITNFDDWMRFGALPARPVHLDGLTEEFSQLRVTTSTSDETASRNPTPSAFPSTEDQVAVPEAVEQGRAVAGPNGTLICKFFQGGTCRYGHNCWFSHPLHNENKSICRHWMKGQCRMGLSCNFRHGTRRCAVPHRAQRLRPVQQDPSAPGPSGEGPTQPVRRPRPSVVVLVSDCGSTVQHSASGGSPQWGNLPSQAGAANRSLSSDQETFFDAFSSSFQQ